MLYKVKANSWKDISSIFELISIKNPLWVFRGQADSQWGLETTFEREGKRHSLDSYFFNTCEENILKEFQRQSNQYLKNLPEINAYIDWLALIQHYGGPTRLLDFTYSFYVAAFFAIKNAVSDSAIWAINVNYLMNSHPIISGQIGENSYSHIINDYVNLGNKCLHDGQIFTEKEREQNIYIVEPFNQEQRLAVQQGVFLFPTDIEKPFQENLCKALKVGNNNILNSELKEIDIKELSEVDINNLCIVKILLTKPTHDESANQLRHMNISDATLFPGIDGFAKSLSFNFHNIKWAITRPRE